MAAIQLGAPDADGNHGHDMVEAHDGMLEARQESSGHIALSDVRKGECRHEQKKSEGRPLGSARRMASSACAWIHAVNSNRFFQKYPVSVSLTVRGSTG